MQVPAGRLLHVAGANGAGKTSLLRIVCGLLSPSQGEVCWRQQPVARARDEFNRELVYLGHAAALKDDLSCIENLASACQLTGLAPTRAQMLEALALAGLAGREKSAARVLSQGQRRRVALARLMLATSVPLWVLDEPFNALDAVATQWLQGLLAAHLARAGVVVLTSHQGLALPQGEPPLVLQL